MVVETKVRRSLIRDMEERVAQMTIDALLKSGYQVAVNDGEETVLDFCEDRLAIFAHLFSTDEDYLLVRKPDKASCGWVRFIYGNDGFDVINDYTVNLEDALKDVNAFTDQYF